MITHSTQIIQIQVLVLVLRYISISNFSSNRISETLIFTHLHTAPMHIDFGKTEGRSFSECTTMSTFSSSRAISSSLVNRLFSPIYNIRFQFSGIISSTVIFPLCRNITAADIYTYLIKIVSTCMFVCV